MVPTGLLISVNSFDLLVAWTIRLSMVLFGIVLIGRLTGTRPARGDTLMRGLWTFGWLLAAVHVGAAFHLVHDWSHAAAFADTARQTAEQVGWPVGAGVYFNYAFIAVWGADVAWWWFFPAGYRDRSRGWSVAIDGYLAFIAFSATVVFESGLVRWAGVAMTVMAAVLVLSRRLRNRARPASRV